MYRFNDTVRQLLTEAGKHGSKGCVMVMLSPKDCKPILKYLKKIPKDDLAEDGLEEEPHVTALYGLTNKDPEPIKEICKEFGTIKVNLGKLSSFNNETQDVLKVSVTSPDLRRLNKLLCKLPYENDYPKYTPHLTLAYLKPGKAVDYVGEDLFGDTVLEFEAVVYSDADHKRTKIPLL